MNTMTEAKNLGAPIALTDGQPRYESDRVATNIGKKGEHRERRFFTEERARQHC